MILIWLVLQLRGGSYTQLKIPLKKLTNIIHRYQGMANQQFIDLYKLKVKSYIKVHKIKKS